MEITNPYRDADGAWLKGQLHVHSTRSDGADQARDVIADYGRRGYDFVVLTDHNAVPAPDELAAAAPALAIPGEEYACDGRSGRKELGVIGVDEALPEELPDTEFVEAAAASGAFVVFNHPTWHIHHWPMFRMLKLRGAHALEVYNGVIDWLPGASECADKWDRLLSCGYRLWGAATDDAHRSEHRDRGWVMVDAAPSRQAIVAALKAGRFYASSGVRVTSIRLEGRAFVVESADAQEVRFFADRGSMRHSRKGPAASYEIQEQDIYVRAELYGEGAAKAWTQPLFVESERSRELADEFRNWYLDQQRLMAQW